ncbi:MAG: carboxypeptidase-like regulatory domain-containing protein [Acidobacteriota bacterium]
MSFHRSTVLVVACALVLPCLWAQQGRAIVQGTVAGPQGPLEGVTVRALNLATGISQEAVTPAGGGYSLTLPAGSYDLFVTKVSYGAFTRRGMALEPGKAVRVDATLPVNANFGVPGEYAFGLMGAGAAAITGIAPRTTDGKPDLSGVWYPSGDVDPDEPPYLPWAAALQKQRVESSSKDDPRAHCLPSGVVRTNMLDLTKFLQLPGELVILIEGSPPGFRQVFLDGRPHPADLEPSWMGHSSGRWDGDTLVIDTVGFHDKGWLDVTGKPQTEKLHVIERMRRASLGVLEIEITIDDAGAYARPWKLKRILKLAPGEELREYVCNENEKPEHLVGKAK